MPLYQIIIQSLIDGFTMGSIYAIIGLGFMIVFNVTQLFNLLQGEFVMIGAMIGAGLYAAGVPLVLAIIISIIATSLIGGAIWGIFLHRPLAKGSSHVSMLLILTILILFVKGLGQIIFGQQYRELPYFLNIDPIHLGDVTISPQSPVIWGVLICLVVSLGFLYGHTLLGKGLRACSEQPLAARLMGINPHKMAILSFILAAALGSLAGIVLIPYMMASYSMGLHLTLKGMLAAAVGGINKVEGVIVGSMFFGMVESLYANFGPHGTEYYTIVALGVFILALLIRPHGILGEAG